MKIAYFIYLSLFLIYKFRVPAPVLKNTCSSNHISLHFNFPCWTGIVLRNRHCDECLSYKLGKMSYSLCFMSKDGNFVFFIKDFPIWVSNFTGDYNLFDPYSIKINLNISIFNKNGDEIWKLSDQTEQLPNIYSDFKLCVGERKFFTTYNDGGNVKYHLLRYFRPLSAKETINNNYHDDY